MLGTAAIMATASPRPITGWPGWVQINARLLGLGDTTSQVRSGGAGRHSLPPQSFRQQFCRCCWRDYSEDV